VVERLQREDIQGIILSGYVDWPWSAYVLLTIDPAQTAGARRWLAHIADEITTAADKPADMTMKTPTNVNVALTITGLAHLGVDRATLDTFAIPFIDGMNSALRSRILGDCEDDGSPKNWRWGGLDRPVDVLLMLYADGDTAANRDALVARMRQGIAASGALAEVALLEAGLYPDRNEHFGFADGVGQPAIDGTGHASKATSTNVVRPGEFLLGYENEYGYPADAPAIGPKGDLGKNGSYLVFRQTTQDVPAFWQFLDAQSRTPDGRSDPAARDMLGAKFVGRWKSGAPLALAPDADDPSLGKTDEFGYAETDPHGFGCPLGAHARRANPRDALLTDKSRESLRRTARHRLMRRGRSYGDRILDPMLPDGKERGLHFICLCADLARQFEFVQQTWLNNPVFGGLAGEVDPVVGGQPKDSPVMTLQKAPVRRRITGVPSFVTLVGGAYFFVPGIKALRWLATGT
jgi:Dyp-type peroxidase family